MRAQRPNPEQEISLEDQIKDLQKQNKKLREDLKKLVMDNTKMEIVLKENGLSEEILEVSNIEAICEEQIKKLKEQSATRMFNLQDTKILDLLSLNLQRIRGGRNDKKLSKQAKAMSDEDLVKLLETLEDKDIH